jgi:small-conductance mechanosensitive channel
MRNALQSLRNLAINDPMELVLPVVTFAVVFVISLVVRNLLLRAIKAWNARQQSRAGRILYEALRGPLLIWSLMLALHFALQSSDLPARYTATGAQILFVLWIFSLTIMLVNVVGDIVRWYGTQVPGALPVTTLTQTLAQIAVLVLGVSILLAHYDVSITPILTALGVGGLAVALALQDTLSNLFGGFYVAVAGQVRLGDYIKLNTGEEGYVTDIGWRVTTLRALANNLIIVPNAKLSQAIVTNYNLPERRLGTNLVVTVPYDCDLEQVEQAIGAVLKEAVAEIPGLLPEPAPTLAFDPGFAENGIGLTVIFQVEAFATQAPVRNALRRRIFNRFKELGISVPYPSRTVYVRGTLPGEESRNNLQPGAGERHP